MFILGFVVGPLIGLLLADFLLTSQAVRAWMVIAAITLVCVVLAAVPAFPEEFRIGVVPGIALGALLSATPQRADQPERYEL